MTSHVRTPKTVAGATLIVVTVALGIVGVSALAGAFRRPPRVEISMHKTGASSVKMSVPPPVRPAFVPHDPSPLSDKSTMSRWAPVRVAVAARAQPRPRAPIVARIATRTPEGTVNITSILGSKEDRGGHVWVRVSLPVLPNGTTGWVPRAALGGYGYVATRLVVNVESFRVTLLRGDRAVFKAAAGVGKASSPTPKGEFFIRDRVTDFNNPFYGPVAFGTSARSNTLTDWPGGGFIGIHGTNQPALIPGAISHGCIRLANKDITKLAKLMPVGTPVVIR
jgi:lipoprotein-anchoring transpeptidase ErfK/SrfK